MTFISLPTTGKLHILNCLNAQSLELLESIWISTKLPRIKISQTEEKKVSGKSWDFITFSGWKVIETAEPAIISSFCVNYFVPVDHSSFKAVESRKKTKSNSEERGTNLRRKFFRYFRQETFYFPDLKHSYFLNNTNLKQLDLYWNGIKH